jgi:hypothetical protein
MTEPEWLDATDWIDLLPRVRWKKNKNRKLRLFSAACCRRIAHLFEDPRADEALRVSEQFADDETSGEQLREAQTEVLIAVREAVAEHGPHTLAWARDAVWRTTRRKSVWEGAESCQRALNHPPEELTAQVALFRDIFGNPFRRMELNPSWLTSDVTALAAGIYADRAFDRMPILADALQDGGCDDELVLAHCRDTDQIHVRGCWVVDVILGKK